jgi:hypothetical protein
MDFRITMLKNAAHPFGVLRSKGKKKKKRKEKKRKLYVFKLILIFSHRRATTLHVRVSFLRLAQCSECGTNRL